MIGSRQSFETTDPTPEFHMFRSSYDRKPGFRGLVYWQCGLALSSIFIAISIAFFLLTGGFASKAWKGKEKSEEKTEFVQDAGGLDQRG